VLNQMAAIGWLSVILLATVPWGDVHLHAHWSNVEWLPFAPPLRRLDVIGNVLLFVPLGALVTKQFRGRGGPAVPGSIALVLSGTLESIQLLSHTRVPSTSDVLCNVAGSLVGICVAQTVLQLRRGTATQGMRVTR
jgi:glycopeptide antibiotics resistance protein